jgi:predicted O-methyltransferase YrrM
MPLHRRGLIREYWCAIALLRRIRALPATLDPAAAVAFARSEAEIMPNQKEQEIVWLLEQLAARPPRVVLEIGTDRGGTLFLWTRVAAADALLIALDVRKMFGRLGRWSPFALVRSGFARERQRVDLIDGVDSHAADTVKRVQAALAGRSVDFLFIDAGHAYEDARQDFELYEPLVRPGGIVAFHDVSPRPTADTVGIAAFWAELKASHETRELIADGEAGYGIGVYYKPE